MDSLTHITREPTDIAIGITITNNKLLPFMINGDASSVNWIIRELIYY